MAKKAKVVPIDEQLKNHLKQILTQTVQKDELEDSKIIIGNIENVLVTNRDHLSKMFDENYQAFKTFMNCISEAVRDHYNQMLTTIPSTKSNLRNALVEEGMAAASGIFEKTRNFVEELAREKVAQVEVTRGRISVDNKGESITYDGEIDKIEAKTQELKYDEAVQAFTERYLAVCAEQFTTEKSPLIDASTPYTAENLNAFLAAHKDEELAKLYGMIGDDKKEDFAKAISTQVKAHEKALKDAGGNMKTAKKAYDKHIADAEKTVEACEKKIKEIKSKISEVVKKKTGLLDSKLMEYGLEDLTDKTMNEKLSSLIDTINKSLKNPDKLWNKEQLSKDLYDLSKASVSLHNLGSTQELYEAELKEAKQQKAVYEAQRRGIDAWKSFDDKNKAQMQVASGEMGA